MKEFERIRAHRRALEDRVAERIEPTDFGDAIFVDSLPDVYDLNHLRAERGTAIQLAGEADRLMETFLHRKVVTHDDHGGDFRAIGWHTIAHLVMAQHRAPDRRVETSHVRAVPFDAIAPLRALEYADETLGARMNESKRRFGSRWLAAFEGDAVAAWCEVRSGEGITQVEDVNTLPEFRDRGHARALVQHASDEADGLVWLEALEDDWPRDLYAKLGFDVVDRRVHHLLPPHRLTAIRIRTARLELRLATVAELRRLYRVAEAGVHDPAVMPMEVPWTDSLNEPSFLAYHRDTLSAWRTDDWQLNLITFFDGEPIGSQGITGKRFSETRHVTTGSWLGRSSQGRGFGTEMRSAILSLAFGRLGASVVSPRGEPLEHTELELTHARFRPLADVQISGVDPAWFGAA